MKLFSMMILTGLMVLSSLNFKASNMLPASDINGQCIEQHIKVHTQSANNTICHSEENSKNALQTWVDNKVQHYKDLTAQQISKLVDLLQFQFNLYI